MASSNSTCSCDPCLRKGLSPVVAVQYCTDCGENLCVNCLNAHSLFKSFASHHLIDSRLIPVEKVSVNNVCTTHKAMVLDFVCVDHGCLCCRSCMTETHRSCNKLVPIDVASNGVRRSYMLENAFSNSSRMHGTLEKLIINCDENIKRLNDEEANALKNISRIKSNILERLDVLERKVISEIKTSKAKCETQIQSDMDNLSKMMECLDEVTNKLHSVSKHGSENQLFILLNSCKLNFSDTDIKIQKIIASMLSYEISLKQPPHDYSAIEFFGLVHTESTPCPIKYKVSTSEKAHIFPTTIKTTKGLEFDFKFEINSTHYVSITSIALTDDNRLLLSNKTTNKLLAYSDRGEYLQDCILSSEPWDIAVIPGEDKAVVSLPKSIQFVDIKLMKSGDTHTVPGYCYGITIVGDKICVGGNGNIYILNKEGQQTTTTIVPGVAIINHLHPGPDNSVYFTSHTNNKVGCVKRSGEVCFTCTPENFSRPEAVATDRGGNLYIACQDSNNIHRLSPDGIVSDITLEFDKTICNPYVLAFSRNYHKLNVTNYNEKSVFVFSVS